MLYKVQQNIQRSSILTNDKNLPHSSNLATQPIKVWGILLFDLKSLNQHLILTPHTLTMPKLADDNGRAG